MAAHKHSPRQAAAAELGKHQDRGGLRLFVLEGGAKKWLLLTVTKTKLKPPIGG